MEYITGEHALNLKCSLDTSGDWHYPSMNWNTPTVRDTADSFFGDYGIEQNRIIPNIREAVAVANHIRALLDLLEDGNFAIAKGMREGFIGNDRYTKELFDKVYSMKALNHWDKIDRFMGSEYYLTWEKYKRRRDDG